MHRRASRVGPPRILTLAVVHEDDEILSQEPRKRVSIRVRRLQQYSIWWLLRTCAETWPACELRHFARLQPRYLPGSRHPPCSTSAMMS